MAGSSVLRGCSSSTQSPFLSRHVWLLFAIFTILAFLANGAHADCYWPDGTENDEHQPCYSPHGGAIGLCCSTGDVCLSNGVCMSGGQTTSSSAEDTENSLSDNVYYRGTCTYKTWSEGKNCPTMCLKGAGISPHTDVGIIPCPDSDTNWYCADGNMNKANCSSGAFIVSLAKPVLFTTIGISPSKTMHTATPTTTSTSTSETATATASSDDSTSTTGLVTATGNATSPGSAPTGFSSGVSGSPVVSPTSGSPSSSSSPTAVPPPPPPENSNSASNVPLAVGVTIGGASIVAAIVIGYFLWRRRKRDEPAAAESPPPRDVPDDDILNSVLEGSMFRSGSLLSRRPSKTYLNSNMGGGDGQPSQPSHQPPMPDSASVFSGHQRSSSYQRADSLHSGSMLSSFQQFQQSQQQQQYEQKQQQQQEYQQFQHQNQHQNQQQHQHQQHQQHRQSYEAPVPLHQPHPQRQHGHQQARFSPDAVAMHNLRRTPPVAWGHQGGGPSVTSEPIPEIPYDPRRMAPYHGVPMMEHNNYSELPG